MRKVIEGYEDEVVTLKNIQESKIYAFEHAGTIYKAHTIGGEFWSFISLSNSVCWANGKRKSLQDLIRSNLSDSHLYEFDNINEFLKWAIKEA